MNRARDKREQVCGKWCDYIEKHRCDKKRSNCKWYKEHISKNRHRSRVRIALKKEILKRQA